MTLGLLIDILSAILDNDEEHQHLQVTFDLDDIQAEQHGPIFGVCVSDDKVILKGAVRE